MSIDRYTGSEGPHDRRTENKETFSVSPEWWAGIRHGTHAVVSLCTFGMWALVYAAILFQHYRKRGRTQYILDGDRLRLVDGGGLFSSSSTKQIPVRDIRDIETKSGVVEGWFDLGTVTFHERDGMGSKVTLSGISQYEQVARTLGKLQDHTAKETRYR